MTSAIATPANSERTLRTGSGTPLLLIHGLGAGWRVWQPIVPALAAHHEIIAPTLSGHLGAAAAASSGPVTVSSLVDALEGEMDQLGLETAHVVGNSLGGRLALELARRGRARSVVAFSPAAAGRNRGDVWRAQIPMRLFVRVVERLDPHSKFVGSARGRRALMSKTVRRPELLSAADMADWIQGFAGASALRDILDDLWRTPNVEPLPDPGCPVVIAWPECDQIIPFERYGWPLLKLVPSAQLIVLKNVGHVPMSDEPELVVQTILNATSVVDRSSSTASASDPATRQEA